METNVGELQMIRARRERPAGEGRQGIRISEGKGVRAMVARGLRAPRGHVRPATRITS